MNSSQIGKGGSAYYDMGGDDGSSISQTAKDVYSYSLHYYDDAGRSDYRPIGRAVVPAPFSNFEQVGGSVSSPLYNGNIAAMGVQIDYGAGGGGQGTGLREPLLYAYRYDQLNRLVGMQAHRNLVNNQWRPVALDDYREWVSYDANGNIRSYDRNGTTTAYGTPAAGHALEMDRLSYGYTEVSLNGRQVLTSNRLRHVKDQVSDAGRYTEDIDNQADDNYSYDAIGNLVRDQQGGNEEIRWTVYGKIAGIHKTDGTQVYYSYDAAGNRISKTVDRSGSTNPSAGVTTTWYVRDAQGNVLSTYEKRGSSPLEQTELHLYGSSRLGIQRTGGLVVEGSLVPLYTYSTETLVRGRKLYELSNHLGNVLATITDKKVLVAESGSVGGTGGVCANGGLVEVLDLYNRDGALSSYRARQEINFYSAFESGSGDEWEGYIDAGATLCDNNGGGGTGSGMPAGAYYVADLVSGTDYAPFGMGLVGRTYNAGAYKYGYNGKERDKDIGEDSYDYGMRISDQRLGRFLSVDPISTNYPWYTPYQFAGNNPIKFIDIDGLEPALPRIGPSTTQLNYAGKKIGKAIGEFFGGVGKVMIAFAGVATQVPAAMHYSEKVPKEKFAQQFPSIPNNSIYRDLIAPVFVSPIILAAELGKDPTNPQLWGEAAALVGATTFRFGSKGSVPDIALGLNEPVPMGPPRSLIRFAKDKSSYMHHNWAKPFGNIAEPRSTDVSFGNIFDRVIDYVVKNKGTVKFDITNLKLDEVVSDIGKSALETKGLTNYELNTIMGNKNYLNATEFYENGKHIKTSEVVGRYEKAKTILKNK